jgi:glutaminase
LIEKLISYIFSLELTEHEQLIIILLASARNDLQRLRQAYFEAFDMEITGYDGQTALHVAASHASFESVRFLVEICKVDIDLKGSGEYF